MERARTLVLKILGGVCLGLCLWQGFVFVNPSNGVHAVPGEAATFALGSWACVMVARVGRVIRLPDLEGDDDRALELPPTVDVLAGETGALMVRGTAVRSQSGTH
jgi:hypothetical protein